MTTIGLGTHWWFFTTDNIGNYTWSKISSKIKLELENFNNSYSRFLDNSLVTKLNSYKSVTNFGMEFLDMIVYSQILKQKTEGYFDISVGKILNDIGYNHKFLQFTHTSTQSKSPNFGNTNADFYFDHLQDNVFLQITNTKITISQYATIDFGGFGKGWLIDKISKLLRTEGLKSFTINGGGDIYSTGDTFYLENPTDSSESIGSIQVRNQAIACSSSNRRKFGGNKHHLINPHTAQSSNYYLAVFTQANTALEADVASTILFVTPLELHNQLKKMLNIEYLIVNFDQTYIKSSGYQAELYN